MKILMLDNEFPPLGGGTGVINYNVLKEMAEMDVSVHLVTSSRSKADYEFEQFSDRIQIFKVPVNNHDIHHASNRELLTYLWRGTRYCAGLMKEHQYDLSIAWAGVPAGGISYWLKKKYGLPYFVSLQGPDVPWYEHRYYWLYPFLKPPILQIWKHASVVTASSQYHCDLALKSAPKMDIGVIFNGVDLDEFNPVHAEERGSDGPVRILCSARLIHRKGQANLIEAAGILKERGLPPFEVLLVGEGDDEPRLRKITADLDLSKEIVFTGFTPRAEMPAVTASCDIFCMPSYNEGMSVALLESLASGLPAVVTETGGTAELIQDNGVIVPWDDSKTLADRLEPLIRDKALRTKMGERSREIASGYSWRAVAERYLEFSEQTLQRSQRP